MRSFHIAFLHFTFNIFAHFYLFSSHCESQAPSANMLRVCCNLWICTSALHNCHFVLLCHTISYGYAPKQAHWLRGSFSCDCIKPDSWAFLDIGIYFSNKPWWVWLPKNPYACISITFLYTSLTILSHLYSTIECSTSISIPWHNTNVHICHALAGHLWIHVISKQCNITFDFVRGSIYVAGYTNNLNVFPVRSHLCCLPFVLYYIDVALHLYCITFRLHYIDVVLHRFCITFVLYYIWR